MPVLSVSDFEQVKLIGSGHFGFVYLAKELSSNSFYALKQVDKLKYLRNNNVEHLFVERDIMARATTQWLVKLQYSFYDATSAYFVMDFLPGGDLMQLLLRSNDFFDEKTARFYLAEACQAINALHSLSYVHRDVKPENLFLDASGHVCLGDFGSAAKLSPEGKVSAKMVVGTPEYVSPEVLLSIEQKSVVNSYGVECDWWSFGVLAYEMVYGCTPFEDDSQMALFNKIMNYDKYFHFPDATESGSGDKPLTVSVEMKHLIRHLLTAPNKRLSYSQIKAHAFFAGLNFERLRSMKPSFVPQLAGPDDAKYFPAPQQQKTKNEQSSPRKSEVVCVSPDNQTMAGFNFVRSDTKQYKMPNVSSVKKERKDNSENNSETEGDCDFADFNRDCSNMMRRLQENDRMISALREEISQRVAIFEQVQLQRDMLERDLTKQMAENALLTRQVSLQRRELENLERAVRNQLSDVRRQLQVKSTSFSQSVVIQTEDNEAIDVESLLEQLSTLREQVETLTEEKSSLSDQLKRAETMAKERAQQVSIQRQSSVRDMESQNSRLRAAEAESRELRRKMDDLRSEHASHDRKTGSELASAKAEIGRLEIELADARERAQTITGLRSRLADAETKVVLLEQRLQRTGAKLEERERQLREKDTPRYSVKPSSDAKISTAVGTSPMVETDKSYKQRFEALEKDTETKLADLTKQVKSAERNRDETKTMLTKLRKALTEAETELETMRRQCEKLRTDQGITERDLRRELEVIRLELVTAKEQSSDAAKNVEAERKNRDSLTKELGEVRQKLNEAESRNSMLEKEIADIAHEIGQIEVLAAKERKVLEKERERRTAAERELSELRSSATVNQKSEATWKTALTGNLEEARKRNDELTLEMTKLNAEKVSVECDLKSSKSHVADLESQLQEVKRRLAEANEKLANSENLREDLATRLTQLGDDHDALQRQFAQTENAHAIEKYRLETTIHQQIKLIDYIQSKPPQTPSKSQRQEAQENRPPPVLKTSLKTNTKRHEAVPLTGVTFPESTDFTQPRSVPPPETSAEPYGAVTPPNNNISATTSLLALGPHRSNLSNNN